MMDQDYKVISDNDECIIKDKNKNKVIVTKGKIIKDRLYKLILTLSDTYALRTIIKFNSDLWHRRFRHLNYRSLVLIKRTDMVNRLPNIEVDKTKCERCLLSKQHRESFPSYSYQETHS